MSASALWDIGQETLTAVVDTYSDAGLSLPSRRFVTTGLPADDCDQVAVWLGRVFTGLPGAESIAPELVGAPRTLELAVRITRCIAPVSDQGTPPSPAQIEATAEALAEDMHALPQGLIARRASGEYLSRCQNLAIGNTVAVEWSGGVGAVELSIQVQIEEGL